MAGSKSNIAKLLRQGDLWLVFGLFGTILLLILPVLSNANAQVDYFAISYG